MEVSLARAGLGRCSTSHTCTSSRAAVPQLRAAVHLLRAAATSDTASSPHSLPPAANHQCAYLPAALLLLLLPAARPLLHALLLQGVAHGYGVELDRVKVAKAEAFCRGVLEELSQRGMFAGSSSGKAAAAAAAVGVKGADAGTAADDQGNQQQQQQEQECTPEESVGSQPCSEPANQAAASIDASNQASTAAATDGSTAAAAAGAGGAAGSGSSKATAKGSRAKGLLQQPHSRPIITCASIEQVREMK